MMKRVLIMLMAMVLLTMPVSANWFTPSTSEITAVGYYHPYVLTNIADGNLGTQWVYGSNNAWVKYGNSGHKNIDKVRIYPSGPTAMYLTSQYCVDNPACGTGGKSCPAGSWCESSLVYNSTTGFHDAINGEVTLIYYGTSGWANSYEIQFYENTTFAPVALAANFTGTPLSGPVNTNVTFTDLSSGTPTNWSWNFGDGTTSTLQNPTHIYQWLGAYAVTLTVSDGVSNSSLTKTNYVIIEDGSSTTGLTVNLDVKNSISGALISDSTVGIKNTTTGVWRNSTAPTGLVYFDSTDPGYAYPLSQNQTITLAASKTGYSPASTTFAIPYDNYRAYLYLVPGTVTNATGAGTVVVSVLRQKTGLPISGVSVVMDSEGGGQIGMTNSAGSVTLMNVTAGSRTLIASDSGYQTVEKAFDLAAGETKLVSVELVLDGETPVPTYVTPGPTYDPSVVPTYNPDDPFNETYLNNGNYTPGQLNQRGSAGLMAMIGSLLQLWPAILMLGFFKLVKEALS